ncbi:MAG: nitronate monooxygenase [Myxococcales bacterium]|nr:nitronate monooxygenase [Myxococcales bacterium]
MTPVAALANPLATALTAAAGIEVPLICGAMYPCSNPELVAAASRAGGIGIVQPIALVYVHRLDFRAGLRGIRDLADGRPIGLNVLTEQSSRIYLDRMRRWVDIALEEGVRFFVSSLGNPRWVVERARPFGGVVYHDVTERKWGLKAKEAGVDGLIAVNGEAGGHAGAREPAALLRELIDLGLPVVCAGGVGDAAGFVRALELGYAGVQMGTRFIATTECQAHMEYKNAILKAKAADIVLTEKISGVPVAVIRTPYVDRVGTHAGWLGRRLLGHSRTKHWMRLYYSLHSIWALDRGQKRGDGYKDYFQAGRSVDAIDAIVPAGDVVRSCVAALRAARGAAAA